MNKKQSKLAQLRYRAEVALKQAVEKPDIHRLNVDELIHELNVYHTELEIQLEDLQQSYKALETAQQRYTNLFDFAPVGYTVTDRQGIIIQANLTLTIMLGVEREALEKRSFAEYITPDFQDIYYLCRRTLLATQQTQACEVQLQRTDKSIFYAQLNMEIPEQDLETLRIAVVNISTIKQAEDALRRTLAHEKELNKLQTRVLSVVSHEFRTPLSIILSTVDMLDHYADHLTDDKRHSRYETIRTYVWYLNNILQDAYSIDTLNNQVKLKPETFDLLAFSRQITLDIGSLAKVGQKIQLEIATTHETELVTWDQHLAMRILVNLLTNALKYSDTSISCRIQCDEMMVKLQVEDQGMGIPPDDQEHVFEAFYRGTNTIAIRGAGIGLFVTQRAIQAHGGTIRCESRLGEGTTFFVELPRRILNFVDVSSQLN